MLITILAEPSKKGSQALGRSRGGRHLAFQVELQLQQDSLQPEIQAKRFARVVADKGYESNAIWEHITTQSKEAVIPSKSNRIPPIPPIPLQKRLIVPVTKSSRSLTK